MATPTENENFHHEQNEPHRCKMKLEKFQFDILWCYGVTKESFLGGTESAQPPSPHPLGKKGLEVLPN